MDSRRRLRGRPRRTGVRTCHVGHTAVVTGGSRGIGTATARLLAAQGWDLAVVYLRDAEAAADTVTACAAAGRQARAIRADVAVEADVLRLFAEVDESLPPLGALVNNAGIVGPKVEVADLTAARIERMLAVNVTGPILCAREAVRRLSTARGGSGGVIVNVSSVAARIGAPGEYVDYAASKAAIDAFTLGLAKEVATQGIRVNAVRPGIVRTGIHASGGQPDRVERLQHLIPMQRAGEPDEIAAAIAWLCSPEASYVTGSILDVSGGR